MTEHPWESEPDSETFTSHGFPCALVRNPLGVWCGYVGVPKSHPLWGCYPGHDQVQELIVHGGLTYFGLINSDMFAFSIWPSSAEYWVFGFDCGHGSDLAPRMVEFETKYGLTYPSQVFKKYKTIQYARNQTYFLAEQLSQYSISNEEELGF